MKSTNSNRENKVSLENASVSLDEKKLNRREEMEKRLAFFSTLTKKMLENPNQANLDALKEEDEAINKTYLGT
ncbi:hypothetical protein ACQUW5_12990 [Legionella sp. CNM-1927-20]|uniref:hypothetical protein n=1 Tax=Legionella sp. CNM-1927-20 TaxID=3422221 RepID=UPI00403B0125